MIKAVHSNTSVVPAALEARAGGYLNSQALNQLGQHNMYPYVKVNKETTTKKTA